jgi:LysR family transcriptional regulator, transcriptional activator of nhaA
VRLSTVSARIALWFERLNIKPRAVGEFEESALLATFGAAGMGVVPASKSVHDKLTSHYDVKRLGPCKGVEEHVFTTGTDKEVLHPLAHRLLPVKEAGKG